MKCKSCGAIVDEKWKYCPNCSKKISENNKIFIIIFIVFLSYYSFFSIIKKNITIN